MYFNISEIKKLQKTAPKIDFLDVGSFEGTNGWLNIIADNLNTVGEFEAQEGMALFNKKMENKDFFFTKYDQSRSSLFEPNKILSIYERQATRLDFEKKNIKTDTLDNLFLKKNIDLIKIDTQGSEYEILEGGLNCIKKDKPLLFLETWSFEYYKNIKLFDQIIALLRTVGYELYGLDTSASQRVDLRGRFESIGRQRISGVNLFMAPKLEEIKKLDINKRIKISFIFFVHDLLSHAYFLIDDIQDSEFKTQMELLIKKRAKYEKFYEFKKLFATAMKFFGYNKSLFNLT